MQLLGLFGILRESFKIINIWRKMFNQITLSLILLLTFIFSSQIEATHFLLRKVMDNQNMRDRTQSQTGTASYNQIFNLFVCKWTNLLHFQLVYSIFFRIIYLISTSAVVYTTACIYTGRKVTFKKVMTVVPKAYQRLFETSLCVVLFDLLYSLIAAFVLALTLPSNNTITGPIAIAVAVFLLSIYFVGIVYMNIIWKLGFVISVLEDIQGTKALQKSIKLLKGKTVVVTMVAITLYFLSAIFQFALQKLFLHRGRLGLVGRMAYGSIWFSLLFKVIILEFVIHTVVYFICKSYHHETKSDNVGVYFGD